MPAKQSRACANCHRKKIKCDIGESNLKSCTNCCNLKIQCKLHVRKRRTVRKRDLAKILQPSNYDTTFGSAAKDVARYQNPEDEPGQRTESSYLGRANYLGSDVPINEEDASKYEGLPHVPVSSFDSIHQQVSSLNDIMPRSLRESLVAAFTKKCLPWMPLLETEDIDNVFNATQTHSLLMLAILTAGCKVSTSSRAADLAKICYNQAKVKFFTEPEQITLSTIIATVFLQWWNGAGPEHVSINNSSFWLRIGVALAHQIGLHNEPDVKHPQARLRRKLWWTLVSRDNQIATSHGRPRAISMSDCSIRPMSVEDFSGPMEDALLFISFVRITNILGDLAQACLRGNLSNQTRIDIEQDLLSWLSELPANFHLFDRKSKTLLPYNFRSRQLHVPFFVALIILFRYESPETSISAVSLLAASFISAIYEEFLDRGDLAFVSPPSIFYLLVATLIQLSSYRFPSLCAHKEREMQISDSAVQQLKLRYTTAFGAERVIKSIQKIFDRSRRSLPLPAMVMSPHSLRFFELFGPGFVLHWTTVFQPSSPQINRPLQDRAVSAEVLPQSSTWTSLNEADHLLPRHSPAHNFDTIGPWPGLAESNFDSLNVDFGSNGQDFIGQWWWSDFLET